MSKAHEVKAVICTDFQLIKTYIVTTYLLWIPVGILVNLIQGGLFFSLCTVCGVGIFGTIMQIGTSDEVSGNFQLLRLTFPVSRVSIQIGHFITVLLSSMAGFLIGVLSAVISQLILNVQGKGDVVFGFYGELSFSLILFAFFLFIGAIMLVCLAKFGFTKGFRYFPIFVALIALLVLPLLFDSTFGNSVISIMTSENGARLIAALLALLFSAVIYGGAMILSASFYKSRQF